MTRLRPLLAATLLATAAASPTTAAAPAGPTGAGAIRFSDVFSAPGNWAGKSTATHTVTVQDGRLRVASTARVAPELKQPFAIGPAATWRASVDMVFTQVSTTDEYRNASLMLTGPDGADDVFVTCTPDGSVNVSLWRAGQWTTLLPWTRSAALRQGSGASNAVTLERESGYLKLFINGTLVGRTPVVDFTPRQIGVISEFSSPAVVEFDNLRLEETGLDSRYAHLLGLQAIPGAQLIYADDFRRAPGQAERWSFASDEWKTTRLDKERLLFTGLKPETSQMIWATPDSYIPGVLGSGNSGQQLSARVAYVGGDGGYARGIALVGDGTGQAATPYVSLQIVKNQYRVTQVLGNGSFLEPKGWTWSDSILPDGDNLLTLVRQPDGRVLAFINGEFQATVTPQRFGSFNVGVFGSGPQTFAVDDIVFSEL